MPQDTEQKSTGKNGIHAEAQGILEIKKSDQYKTVDELMRSSQADSVYFTLLILSTLIVVSGLLLNNGFIVVGGMLVAPLLTPILLIALSLAIGELDPIRRVGIVLARSCVIITGLAVIMTFVIGAPESLTIFENTIRTAILYFLVAIVSGIAATFALVRKDVSDLFPGVAIAVALVPPLALIGIWLASFNVEHARYYVLVFIFNLLGIVIGSTVVFMLLKFNRVEKKVAQLSEEAKVAEEARKEAKREEKEAQKEMKEGDKMA